MNEKHAYSKEELEALRVEHETIRVMANTFSKELAHQIERLLEEEHVALGFPIQERVKEWSSVFEKLERVGFHVASVKDFQDLVGLRLIVLFKRDVVKVCDVITNISE